MFRFVGISAPFQAPTTKTRTFEWDEEKNEAFERFKKALTTPSVLAFTDFEETFVVEIDVTSIALGAVLVQKKEDGKIEPVEYASQTMTPQSAVTRHVRGSSSNHL